MQETNGKKYRNSKQRQRILEVLSETTAHPTANWIYERLKPEFPSLSLGTIYRNLRILVDQGKVFELKFGSTFDRYDADTRPHYHFICEVCGRIEDVELEHEAELNAKVEALTNHRVDYHRLEFYGKCQACSD
ncbi:MAG: transcriptional repressor [Calditrichaeota bacterium]|nr:MAG: transcriptional repressor [Calditrichota bacterium]